MVENDVEKQSLIKKNKKNNLRSTIGISVLVFVIIALLATFATLIYFRAKGLKNDKNDKVVPASIPTPDVKDVLKEEPVNVIPKPHDVVNIPPSGPISPIEPLPMPLDPVRIVTDDPDQVEDLPEPPVDPLPKDIPEEVPAPKEEALPDPAVEERPKLKPEEMTVENITKAFVEFADAKKIHVIDGDFYTCSEGGCINPGGKVIHKWKLDAVAAEFEGKPDIDLEKEFDTIVQYFAHNKQFGFYYKDVEDYKMTFKIFRDNVKIVEEHNKDPDRLYDMELNNFAAYSSDNIVTNKRFIEPLYTETKSASGFETKKNQEIDVDWRKEGKVSQVVQQGACGSCWAVAATDVVNSFMSIKKKKPVKLSIQQVVDCTDPKYTCKTGGYHGKALNYLMNNKMCSNDEYKYTAHDAKCLDTACQQDTEVKEVKRLNHEDALEHLKRKGPFLTSFKTNTKFLLYADGIFNGDCKYGQGHSVVVVGHGRDTEKNVDYWIVKNSWDTFWGEAGYFRMLDSFEMLNGEKYHHCNFLAESYGVF